MSRWEFMRQLEELLSDISPGEREEALQYYNDYFNDAGRENEKEVIKALGSPAQVARIVKDGLGESGGSGEFTESGYQNARTFSENPIIKRDQAAEAKRESGQEWKNNMFSDAQDGQASVSGSTAKRQDSQSQTTGSQGNWNRTTGDQGSWSQASGGTTSSSGTYTESGTYSGQRKGNTEYWGKKGNLPTWAVVLIVIACICLAPAIIGVIGGIIGAVFGAVATVAGVVLGVGVAAIVFFFVGIMLIIAGFGCMFAHPFVGVGLLGGGCICIALGILAMLLTGFLAGKCIPAICRGIAHICKKIIGKRRGAVA